MTLETFGLTLDGCRDRQHILREYLRSLKLDAALLVDPRHVYSLTGYWGRSVFRPMVLIERDGPTVLAVPSAPAIELAADEVAVSQAAVCCTLVDDQAGASLAVLRERLDPLTRIGCDSGLRAGAFPTEKLIDFLPTMFAIRRCKDEDELAFLQQIIGVTEEVYGFAKSSLRAGMTEVELWAAMFRVASERFGETLGEFGNDFQIGALGSPPRRRACEAGEVAILDLSLVCRGYHSDMCRSFVIGTPSDAQTKAHGRILEVFSVIERMARPGVAGRVLYEAARDMLDGYEGWSFFHHLGHGVGMNGHEAPRLHGESNDRLEVGDVFTFEPGLYGPDLKPGLRIEQMYHVGEKGIERLTSFPVDMDCGG